MTTLLLKKFHDLLVEFLTFPWPQSFSMTFLAWKIPFLNSTTFQDVWKPCINRYKTVTDIKRQTDRQTERETEREAKSNATDAMRQQWPPTVSATHVGHTASRSRPTHDTIAATAPVSHYLQVLNSKSFSNYTYTDSNAKHSLVIN